MLLFKNGFKKFVKDSIQFIIYVLLVLLGAVFTSTFGISSSNLIRTKNEVTRNYTPFDYSFRYTSSGYESNNSQTLNPWFAFNVDMLSANNTNYSTLTIGGDGVLRPYEFNVIQTGNVFTYESSIYRVGSEYYTNFGFGDTELTRTNINSPSHRPQGNNQVILFDQEQRIDVVRRGEFGRFYRFNFENERFKNSLIGRLYERYGYFQGDLSDEAISAADSIFNYMFYLNNSAISSMIKATITSIWLEFGDERKVEQFINWQSDDNEPNSFADIQTNGYNGRFGHIFSDNQYFFVTQENSQTFSNTNQNHYARNQLLRNGTYLIKDFESTALFWNPEVTSGALLNQKIVTSRSLFESYFIMLGKLTNFNVELTSEVVTWNADGQKFRIVSAFHTETIDGVNQTFFYNEDSYTIFKQLDSADTFTGNSFMSSSGWARSNGWKLGQEYSIIPNNSRSFRLDAIGTDYYNIYPTIYEEDLLTDQSNEAIFYVNSQIFSLFSSAEGFDNSGYQDVSRAYLRHTSPTSDMIEDIELFGLYLADNMVTLNEVADAILNDSFDSQINYSRANLESRADTRILILRSELIITTAKNFLILSIVFCIIFMICILFMVYTITRKVMISQRGQIGNLKSLGYSNSKILINYILYLIIPTLIIIPIAWTIGVFLQTPIMNIFETYFNIPSLFTVDWTLLLAIWIGFTSLNALVVGIVASKTIFKNPLELMAPSKKNQPNLFLTRIMAKIRCRRFTSKLRLILISSSISSLTTFFGVMTAATLVLLFSSILPSSMSKMKEEYFLRINYNNDYRYSSVISNNPLTRLNFYNLGDDIASTNNQMSSFNTYIRNPNDENQFLNLLEDLEKWEGLEETYIQVFEDILFNNITTFKGVVLSPRMLDEVIEAAQKINTNIGRSVRNSINMFTCQVLPTIFDQEIIDGSVDYNSCIKSISNNLLPSIVKQMWDRDENYFKDFTFNFSAIPYNQDEDELYTYFEGTDEQRILNVETYGMDLERDSHKIDFSNLDKIVYDENLDYIPVLINEKMRVRGYGIGDEFNLTTTQEKLAIRTASNSSNDLYIIDNSDWSYNGENNFDSLNLNQFTYLFENYENFNDQEEVFYYRDENGDMQRYHNLADVKLTIDTNLLDQELLAIVNDEYKAYANLDLNERIDANGKLVVNPFDIHIYENGNPIKMELQSFVTSGTNSWMNIALKEGLFYNQLVDVKTPTLKVVGVEKLYNGNRIFMDQKYANQILGFTNSYSQRKRTSDNSSVNIWSNAKLSSNDTIADNYFRHMLAPNNMNNTTNGFSMFMRPAIGSTDFLDMNRTAIEKLISSALAIVLILIMICIITSIIVIYLMTDMFVGRYKEFMGYMRVQGYHMKEINSILVWIFLPLTVLAATIGIGMVLLIIYTIIPKALLSLNIAVGFIINWWMVPLVGTVVLSIFVISYSIILKSLKTVQLSKLLGQA